jgi:branched-chain amino acid transport system substrate-binding protein
MHRLSRILFSFAILAGLLVSIGAQTSTASTVAKAKTINIGFIGELTGVLGAYGAPNANAVKLAVHQINSTGGIKVNGQKYKFKVNMTDDQSSATVAAANAQGLVNDNHIKFIFGGLAFIAPVVLQITDAANAIYFTGSSAAAALSGTAEGKNLFLTVPATTLRYTQAVNAIKGFLPAAKTAVLVGYPDSVDASLFPGMTTALQAQGISVAGTVNYPSSTTDFSTVLASVKSYNADVVIVGSSSPSQNQTLVQQNGQLSAAPATFLWGGACNIATLAGVTGNVIGDPLTGAYVTPPVTTAATAWVNAYVKLTGIPYATAIASPLYIGTEVYDFVFMLAKAMEAAKTVTNTAKISLALHGLTYKGLIGSIHYNYIGQPTYPSATCQYNNSTLTVKSFAG